MDTRVIRTEEQHRAYLDELHKLMTLMPTPGSENSERLELLIVLLEAYESKRYPVELPDPVDAIIFRMQEKGYKQADLIPYFGTRSRVSEILSRKRPLTVPMIRAISIGLGISAETLIGVGDSESQKTKNDIDWSRFPVQEMIARGWIQKFAGKVSRSTEDIVQEFISQIGWQFGDTAFKRSLAGDAYSPTTKYALYAWLVRVIQKSREKKSSIGVFSESVMSASFLQEVARLSWFDNGPLLAVEFLQKSGIALIVEPHLKGTLLDGAALKDVDGQPIIGMTLRHDRLDNFWFTLLHELAHLWKHVGKNETFLDDLDATSEDKREAEANRLAREAFIPRILWRRSEACLAPSRENIDKLSRELKIHPSIIAGRIRRETENYQLYNDLIGHGDVRRLFFNTSEGE